MYGLSKRIYLGLFFVVLLFAGLKFAADNETMYTESRQSVAAYRNGWENEGSEKAAFSNILPEEIGIGSGICFFTKNQYVEVFIGERQVYAVLPLEDETCILPVSQWHLIDLSERYGGEKITLRFYGKEGKPVKLPDVSIGSKDDLLRKIILRSLFPFVLSTVLISVGLLFCVSWVTCRKRFGVEVRLWYVGLLAAGVGICSIIQTQILQLLTGYGYELNILMYSIIFLIQYPIMKYTFTTYVSPSEQNKNIFGYAINTYLIIGSLLVIGCIFHWSDICLYEITARIVMWMGGVLLFLMMIFACRRASERRKRKIFLHMALLILLGAATAIDLLWYTYGDGVDVVGYSRLIVTVYLGVISFEVLGRFTRTIGRSQDSEKTRDMAYFDALTTMGNRTAFMKDLNEISRDQYRNYGIGMFDLNNLKMFNDVHGHSAGDYYLIISSEIIQDIFGQKGKIFRIGGDEFCALLKNFSAEEFQKGARDMQERMSQLKGPYTKEEMSVAYGYQIFDAKLDHDLSNTLERADISMYEIKQKSKKKINP